MGLIQVPRGTQTKRGYVPSDISHSAAESAAPWVWKDLSELILFSVSRQPIDIYRRATSWGAFSGNVTSTFSNTGRELSFDGASGSYWSQTPYKDLESSYFTSTITVIINPRDSGFGTFFGTTDIGGAFIMALDANGVGGTTVAETAGFHFRGNNGLQLRGHTGSGTLPIGVSSIITYLIDATNTVTRVFINGLEGSITYTATDTPSAADHLPDYPFFFGARNGRGSATNEYNGGVQMFIRHGGVLLSDAAVKEMHRDWFAAIRRRPLLIPVSSATVGSQGITLAGGTFNIVPNSDFTMSGRRPLGEDTWDPNDPGTIAVVQGSASVNEDDGTITLSATRSGGTGAASVNWATQDGTAVDGTDYTADSNTLNWDDLETGTKSAVISIIDRDGVAQGNTEFTWVLSGATGAEIRTDGGEPLDTTTVTINDQDTAGGSVNVLWNGDFEDGIGLGWHRTNNPDFPDMRHWNSYGYPPEFGGNGDLFEIVTTPTRGNDNYSMRVTVKNGANWTEPDDCDESNCTQRRSQMNGSNMFQLYDVMPKMNTYWFAFSVYLDAGWKTGTEDGMGFLSVFGIKPDFLPSNSQMNIQLHGDDGTWRFAHSNYDVYQETAPSYKYMYRYHKDIANYWQEGADKHMPNQADSVAALASVNVGGWTDWVYHVRADYRGAGAGGQGFIDLYKREDSGPWVHVLAITPGEVTWGGLTRDAGIGYNGDEDWVSGYGIYGNTEWFQNASVNQTMFLSGARLYAGDALFDDVVNDRFGG